MLAGGSIDSRGQTTLTSAKSSNRRPRSMISEILILANSTSLVVPAGSFSTVITTGEPGISQPRRAAESSSEVTGRWSTWTITSPLSSKPDLYAGLHQTAGVNFHQHRGAIRWAQGFSPADHHVIDHHSREHQPDLRTQPSEIHSTNHL